MISPDTDGCSLTIPATCDGLGQVQDAIACYLGVRGLSEEYLGQWRLIIEELVGNVIRYAYPPDSPGECRVTCQLTTDWVQLTIEDQGRKFNPLDLAEPDLDCPLAERVIGGLGIFLVRQLADLLNYERVGATNRLTVGRRTSTP